MTHHLSSYIDKIAIDDGKIRAEKWRTTSVKQINLFIGPNNSGKSREIRELFSSNNNHWIFDAKFLSVNKVLECIYKNIHANAYNVGPAIQISHGGRDNIEKNIKSFLDKPHPISLDKVEDFLLMDTFHTNNSRSTDQYNIKTGLLEPAIKMLDPDGKYQKIIKEIKVPILSIYIPTLRTLRSVGEDDIFQQRTISDYFSASKLSNRKSIYTGHSLYNDLVQHLLGTHKQREKVREYEKYLSINFFFGQDISLVPMVKKDVVYFKEGNKEERPIYDLGDGIQSIIILTFPLFMADEETIFFIEEPEQYLHAGLQRTLIETFAKHREHLFFMTTHSNHFLDLAQERSDISIQQVSNNEDNSVVEAADAYGKVLDALGVRASSVLLANCSIWVEGVTDKLYLRVYMKKYISELEASGKISEAAKLTSYHENLHYVFTEYQGSNITHWAFDDSENDIKTPAKKLNRNILLIADSDIDGKGNRVKELEDALGSNFYLLNWKEIENYIPHNILILVAKKRWDTFNQREGCKIDRFENINERMFENKSKGIGEILERYVDKPPKHKRKFYTADSGTIKDKVKFCHTAIEIMSDDKDWLLTPELNKLCEKLWGHVIENN